MTNDNLFSQLVFYFNVYTAGYVFFLSFTSILHIKWCKSMPVDVHYRAKCMWLLSLFNIKNHNLCFCHPKVFGHYGLRAINMPHEKVPYILEKLLVLWLFFPINIPLQIKMQDVVRCF